MKELYKAIQGVLAGDATLIALLGGSANVGQAQSPVARRTPSVSYHLWSNVYVDVDQAKGNRDPQEITILFACRAKDTASTTYGGSTLVVEIAERLKALLHGAGLSASDLHCFASLYDNWESPVEYEEETSEWRLDLRLRFIAVKIAA